MKIKVGVLRGGISSEYNISLKTGMAVLTATSLALASGILLESDNSMSNSTQTMAVNRSPANKPVLKPTSSKNPITGRPQVDKSSINKPSQRQPVFFRLSDLENGLPAESIPLSEVINKGRYNGGFRPSTQFQPSHHYQAIGICPKKKSKIKIEKDQDIKQIHSGIINLIREISKIHRDFTKKGLNPRGEWIVSSDVLQNFKSYQISAQNQIRWWAKHKSNSLVLSEKDLKSHLNAINKLNKDLILKSYSDPNR